jgi:hypothetical protein
VLKGGGDPTLSTAGLRSLAGQVRAPASATSPGHRRRRVVLRLAPHGRGWKPSFYLQESPPLSALVVDRARVGATSRRRPLAAATAVPHALAPAA